MPPFHQQGAEFVNGNVKAEYNRKGRYDVSFLLKNDQVRARREHIISVGSVGKGVEFVISPTNPELTLRANF